ncbi:MAG TPA: ATP-binding cassette domain-containing protein, partial [Candidatus Dormibacteraeota bacterium]
RRARRQAAMVFQQVLVVRRRTSLENVAFGALGELPLRRSLSTKLFPAELKARALDSLDRVGLAEYASQRAGTLSGGQAQRVAIARALTQQPRVLLADEPVASLDPDATEEVMALLRSLAVDEGMAVVCVLHQPELARWHADRIVGLRAGRVVVDSPAAEVDDAALTRLYRGLGVPA